MTAGDSAPILIKPSDASAWISCIRRVWLDKHRPSASEPDAFNQLLSDFGLEHEAVMLARLESQYPITKAVSFEHTQALMQQGAAVGMAKQAFEANMAAFRAMDKLTQSALGLVR